MKIHQREERKKEAAEIIQCIIIPLVDIAAVVSRDVTTIVSPVLSSYYVNKRNEMRRVKKIKQAHPEKQFELTIMTEYVSVGDISQSQENKRSLLLSVPYVLVWQRNLCVSPYLNLRHRKMAIHMALESFVMLCRILKRNNKLISCIKS